VQCARCSITEQNDRTDNRYAQVHLKHISISISIFYCTDPQLYKTEGALHSHYIMCYLEQYARLKINVFSPWRKATQSKSLDAVSYSSSIVTIAVSEAVCEIFSVKEWCDLENRVRVRNSYSYVPCAR